VVKDLRSVFQDNSIALPCARRADNGLTNGWEMTKRKRKRKDMARNDYFVVGKKIYPVLTETETYGSGGVTWVNHGNDLKRK
jgi:hypothetical protein